jgi:GTP-binding protein Era
MSFRSGLVTLAGRPNTGKSTLLNRLVGSHISITATRPQVTRTRILGIKTTDDAQFVFVDTPGLHPPKGRTLNRAMNRVATGSLEGVDVIVLVIEAGGWTEADGYPLARVRGQGCPVILAINKVDQVKDRDSLLPLIAKSAKKMEFAEIVPVSALKGSNVPALAQAIRKYLPEQGPIYDPEQLTDRSERFLAAELVREQVFRGTGQEVPYDAAVRIEQFERRKGMLRIAATIIVEKDGQKGIVIGKNGERLKAIGQKARLAMQKLFGQKVHLELWVKVRRGWAESEAELKRLGYAEEG